jgi:hypothetical protein
VTPSLTIGWVCSLPVQLLLGLVRAVALGPEYRRTHGHILLSHLRLPQPGGPGSRIYIPQEQGGPAIPTGTGFPFCPLLRLSGLLRLKYSNPPSHGQLNYFPPRFDWRQSTDVSEERIGFIFTVRGWNQERDQRKMWQSMSSCWFPDRVLPWRWTRFFPPKHRLSFNGLHALRTSNSTHFLVRSFKTNLRAAHCCCGNEVSSTKASPYSWALSHK